MTIPPSLLSLVQGRALPIAMAAYSLVVLAFLSIPCWTATFPPEGPIRLSGPDAYFHLRHVETVLANFPHLARFDWGTNFPHGERGLNQGLFDLAIAGLVKLSGGTLSPALALAWVSPLCFVATGLLGAAWLARQAGTREALLFLLLLAFYPGPLALIAALGHGDHHAAEVLLALLVAAALSWILRPSTPWWSAPFAALPLFLLALSWAGAPLHLLLVGLTFYTIAWLPDGAPQDPSVGRKGALYGASLLLLTLGTAALAPDLVIWPVSQTIFVLASLALALGYLPLLAWSQRPWGRPWLVAALTLAGAFAVLAWTQTGGAALQSLFATRSQQIAEHAPVSVPLLCIWYGPLWLVAWLGPWRWWRSPWTSSSAVPMLYGAGLIFFWIQTRDFNYYAPPVLAASAAYGLGGWRQPARLRWLLVALVALPLLPLGMGKPWPERSQMGDTLLHSDGLEAASAWLRAQPNPRDEQGRASFGLVTPWDLGNVLAQTAATPVGWSQTTAGDLAQLLFSDQPDQAYQALSARQLRYLLLPGRNLGEKFLGEMGAAGLSISEMYQKGPVVEAHGRSVTLLAPSPRHRAALLCRLYWESGEGLGHYRMVFESQEQVLQVLKLLPSGALEFFAWPVTETSLPRLRPLLEQPDRPLPTSRGLMVGARQAAEVRLFELVPGALAQGSTRPGTVVRASLELYAPTSRRRWTCHWETRASKSGFYSLRLPYSTTEALSPDPNTVRVRGPYRLSVGGREVLLPVLESDVQAERTLVVPLSPG